MTSLLFLDESDQTGNLQFLVIQVLFCFSNSHLFLESYQTTLSVKKKI